MSVYRKKYVSLHIAAVLLVLVLLSCNLVSDLYARFVTTATYEDSARVARFNIIDDASDLFTNVVTDVQPGSTIEEAIILKNYSEVAVEFTVTVENIYHNIPLEFEVKDGEDILYHSETVSGGVVFAGIIGPNQQEKEYKLYISWPTREDNLNYVGKVDMIQVVVKAVQAD